MKSKTVTDEFNQGQRNRIPYTMHQAPNRRQRRADGHFDRTEGKFIFEAGANQPWEGEF